MGAQGLFILGFSLSVEVTFTFLSKSYLVHIILGNKISLIRLLECAKAFPACHGSLTKSLSPFSSTFPLPLARSQIVDCNKIVSVFVSMSHLSIYHFCQFTTFVNLPRLSISPFCQSSPRHFSLFLHGLFHNGVSFNCSWLL